jgi:tetratricopeptide (TPR) repeat protein
VSAEQDDARRRARLARTHLRCVVCARDERYEEAEEACLSAIESDPKEVGPYVMLASVYACVRQYRKMVGVLRRAIGVDAVALRAYLDDESQEDNQSAGAQRKRVNLPEGVEGAEQISHALLGVAMSRIASGEDKEAALALEIALQLNLNNSPAVMLLTATYLLWGKGGDERGRTSALRNIPALAEALFG